MTPQERQERSKYFTPEEDIIFNMLSEETVDRLRRDGDIQLPKKKIDIPKDKRWNTKQIASKLLQGIQNGDSIPKISKSLGEVIGNNKASQVRHARTLTTSAECHGRLDSYKNLADQGVVQKKVWISTPDDRTRPTHIDIDGEEQDIDVPFSNGCMFPGDSKGPSEEVWNCRCSIRDHIVGFRRADGSISYVDYDEDKTLHDEQTEEEKLERVVNNTIKAAKRAESHATKSLIEAIRAGSGHLEGLDFRFKGKESLKRKIADKSAKKGVSREEYARQITDALRYTSISNDESFTADFYTTKKELEQRGYVMVEITNTIWDEDKPYRGINTLIQSPNGYIFELQFHTPNSIEIKEINHKLYEEQRLATTTKEEKIKLNRQMIENAKSIKTPVNSKDIVNKYLDKKISQW